MSMSLFIVYFGLVYCLHFKYSLHYYLKAYKVFFKYSLHYYLKADKVFFVFLFFVFNWQFGKPHEHALL